MTTSALSIPQLSPDTALLALLVSGHVLGDFLAQTDRMSEAKAARTSSMLLHAIVMLAVHLALLLSYWSMPVVVVVVGLAGTHFVIDMANRAAARRFGASLSQFLIDQSLHVVAVVAAWRLLLTLTGPQAWAAWEVPWVSLLGVVTLVFSGFTVAVRGGTMVISKVLMNHPELLPKDGKQLAWGRTAGHLERCLFFSLVLLNQWIALGLVVAAKNWRGGPTIGTAEEYYRTIGFLASMLVAIIAGVLVRGILVL